MNYELSAAVTTGIICEPGASQVAVIPAKAGIQIVVGSFPKVAEWIPAFAGMTAAWSAPVSQMTPLPELHFI